MSLNHPNGGVGTQKPLFPQMKQITFHQLNDLAKVLLLFHVNWFLNEENSDRIIISMLCSLCIKVSQPKPVSSNIISAFQSRSFVVVKSMQFFQNLIEGIASQDFTHLMMTFKIIFALCLILADKRVMHSFFSSKGAQEA